MYLSDALPNKDSKMVLARAAATDGILHTPQLHHADTAGPDCIPRTSTHASLDKRYYFRTAISSAPSTSSSCYPDPRPPEHVSEISRPQPTAAPFQQSRIYSSRLYLSHFVIALTMHRSMLRSSPQLASGTKASRQAHCTVLYLSMQSNKCACK